MKSVEQLAAAENSNLHGSLTLIGDTYNLVTRLESLYDHLPWQIGIGKHSPTLDDVKAFDVMKIFILTCRRHLTVGTLAILRGYRADSNLQLRRAIELTAFAVRIDRHKSLAKLWIDAGTSDAAFTEFRSQLDNKLFPKNDPLTGELYKDFDICSKAIHSSIYGVAPYFAARQSRRAFESHPADGLEALDIATSDLTVVVFIAMIDVHLELLQVFQKILTPYLGDQRKPFRLLLTEVEKQFSAEKKHWGPLISEAIRKRKQY